MAVNFMRIRSPLIYPISSLWNVYTQISRHNSENKDKIEKFLNNLTKERLKLKVNEASDKKSNYNVELVSNYDEKKLLSVINQNLKMTRAKFINLRNTCLEHLVSGNEISMNFYDTFIKLLHTYDANFYEQNESFLMFLKEYILWRENMSDIDVIIKSFSNSYQSNTINNEESLIYQRKVITHIITHILSKNGTSFVVKLKKSFETICEKCHDHELLWILWTKLFESFWFSDQTTADEIMEQHKEVRNLLALRAKQQCFRYFQKGNTELVNKIIQIFLRHNMRDSAEDVIKLYLQYEIWNKNSKAATEIVSFCIKLNFALTDSENEKFVNLLLPGLARSQAKQQQDEKKKKIDIKKYKFQF